jgi:hypothetical protein
MYNQKLKVGDEIAILTVGTDEYLRLGSAIPQSPFIHEPSGNTVHPAVELFTMTASEDCKLEETDYIKDDNNLNYDKLVGPRPRNIFKR